jgi:APA family basic amino acid/polyamine antiporter
MIGAGVLLSAGFMAQDLGPGLLLVVWVAASIVALAGTAAYSEISRLIPRSGGEYRFLSTLLHPVVGHAAGWASLLLGFSAPIAIDALAAGAFAQTLVPTLNPHWVGFALVLLLTLLHAVGMTASKWTQNSLALGKSLLILGFTALGLLAGRNAWPTWQPPHATAGFPLDAFGTGLLFAAFAFSGWNAAVYVAEEFEEPQKNVPRAMLAGCALVALLYLALNWVFVANLTPQQASAVFTYETERVTLGHLIMRNLIGETGARVMSGMLIALFLAAMSAMTFAGPRVYAAMASDGFLPTFLKAKEGRPPTGAILLQGALAIILIFTHRLQQLLQNAGGILVLFSALTAIGLFRARFGRIGLPAPSSGSLVAAGVFAVAASWMLFFGFRSSANLWAWVVVVAVIAVAAYLLRPRSPAPSRRGSG